MTEENTGTDAAATEGTEAGAPPIAINAQYIKDLSFEAPSTPGVFAALQSGAPDVSVNVNVNAQPL